MRPHALFLEPSANGRELGDPRWSLLQFVVIAIATFLLGTVTGLCCLLVYLTLVHRLYHASLRPLLRGLGGMVFFGAFVLVINAILVEGTPLSRPLAFASVEGVEVGLRMALRVAVLYAAAVTFVTAWPPEKLAAALSALTGPFSSRLSRAVAFYGFLSLAFVPLYAEEVRRVHTAQRFRGGGMRGGFLARAHAARLLVVPLIVSAIRRSGQLAMVVEVRGARSSIHRIVKPPQVSYRDVCVAAGTLAAVGCTLFLTQ